MYNSEYEKKPGVDDTEVGKHGRVECLKFLLADEGIVIRVKHDEDFPQRFLLQMMRVCSVTVVVVMIMVVVMVVVGGVIRVVGLMITQTPRQDFSVRPFPGILAGAEVCRDENPQHQESHQHCG